MPALRRALLGTLVLLVAFSACRKREEGPEPAEGGRVAPGTIETEAVAGDLPAGASVVVTVHDLQGFWNRLKATQLYTQIRAIPQVDSLLNPATNPRLAETMQKFQARMGMPLNEQTIFSVVGQKAQIGVYPAAAGDTADLQRVVLVADVGDRDALGSILNNLRTEAEGEGAKYASEKLKGVDVTVVSDANGQVRGLYGFHKEKLVAATDQASLESAVGALDGDGTTMEDDSLYKRALTGVGDASITVYVPSRGLRGLLGAMTRMATPVGDGGMAPTEASLEVMERYSLQSSTIFGAGWSDQGLVVSTYATVNPNAQGAAPLRDMLATPPSQAEVIGYFPDSTLGFYAVNFLDAPKVYQYVLSYARDAARAGGTPDQAAQIDSAIAAFERETTIDVENDVLSWLGKEIAIGLAGVQRGGFFPVPELGLAVQTTDPAKTKALMDKVEAQITAAMQSSGQGFPVQFQSEEYKGATVRFAPTPMGEGLAPGYAIHEDYALIGLSRNTLRKMIDVKTGAGPAVAANAQFKALSGFFPDEVNVVGYANTAQILDEVGAALGSFQQMSGQAGPNQDTLNRTLAALKNIQAVGAYGLTGKDAIQQRFLIRIQ